MAKSGPGEATANRWAMAIVRNSVQSMKEQR
jgi:hypothetical protein